MKGRKPGCYFFMILILGALFLANSVGVANAQAIKYGHNHPTDSPAHMGALAFKDMVEKETAGKITVNIYPAMQLGSNRVQVESLQQNGIQVDWQPAAIVGNFAPEIQLLDLPFLFPSDAVMWKVLDGPYGKQLLQKMEAKNIHGLGFVWTGAKHITANRSITKAKDFAGLKMRVMNSPLLISQFRAWGSNAVSIDFGELYNALQQKVVDGQENPAWAIADRKFFEVQTHFTKTGHAPMIAVLMASKLWCDKLSAKEKQMVDNAGYKAVVADRQALLKIEGDSWKRIQESGIKIEELSAAEKAQLKEISKPVYEEARKKFKEEMAKLEKAVAEAQK